MKDVYSAVVVGSGFGGAVAACRLAQAGIDVAILERGKRYPKGSFPRDYENLSAGWMWELGQGLFDVKPLHEMQVVQAAGWGGGSLIYANVHLRPVADVFAQGWPAGYDRATLDPYYDLVGYMLSIKPITALKTELPPKTRLMLQVAEKLGRGAQFCYPNIAVELDDPGQERLNKFAVPQSGCTQCGECDVGCNIHAKNTLDLNYLALAERAGADVATLAEVTRIEPAGKPGDPAYRVTFRDHGAAGVERSVVGKRVFVCAGAVNSTELLLRCRDEHHTLPAISDALGRRYSGNGDFLAATYETSSAFEPWTGPTITTGIVYDRGEGDERVWFILQDGGFPKAVAAMTELLKPCGAGGGVSWAREADGLLRDDLTVAFAQAVKQIVGEASDDARRTALFLAMGRDRADGRISLVPITNTLRIEWDLPRNLPLYEAEAGLVADLSTALGGAVELNPFWKRLHVPVSVHNLGGCVMADSPANGVTSASGEVHGYPGLYVMDGAILPAATGVNPSSTIAAVAERNIERVIREIRGDATWRAPDWPQVTPIHDPVSALAIPPGGVSPPVTPTVSLAFTEVMKGFVAKGFTPADDYAGATKAALRAGAVAEFELTIRALDLDAFLAEKAHAGTASGKIRGNATGFHVTRRRARDGGGLQSLRRHRFVLRTEDALPAPVHRDRREALPARRVQGGQRPRPLRRLGSDEHALQRHPGGAHQGRSRRRDRHPHYSHSRLREAAHYVQDRRGAERGRARRGARAIREVLHGDALGRLRAGEVRAMTSGREREYDAVIIGSGFGGSISALRLAQAGKRVAVLERGRRWEAGEFPRDTTQVNNVFWRWPKKPESRGLYELRFFSGVSAVVASGVGGGSLVYANIHIRPDAAVFEDERWPQAITRASLDPYYDRVATALGISPVPTGRAYPKRDALHDVALKLGRPAFDPDQAVSWDKCKRCSQCEFGCQYGAKNTTNLTYLAEAERLGAEVWPGLVRDDDRARAGAIPFQRIPRALPRRRDRDGGERRREAGRRCGRHDRDERAPPPLS